MIFKKDMYLITNIFFYRHIKLCVFKNLNRESKKVIKVKLNYILVFRYLLIFSTFIYFVDYINNYVIKNIPFCET